MSLLRRISQSQLVRGSLLVFIGNNIVNFGNFLYNLSMGRLLGPQMYGDLGTILSLFVFFCVPLNVLSLFITKTVSSFWGKKDYGAILALLYDLTPRLFLVGVGASGVLMLASPYLGGFLHLDNLLPLIIVALLFILSGPSTLNKAVLQGALFFFYLTINGFAEVTLKLIIATLLVIMNFGLIGALLGFLISGIAGYLLTKIELKIVLKGVTKRERCILPRKILKTSIPIVLTSMTLTAFLNTDIILVRHFFSASSAGEYVALSIIGKIIYYAMGPVISVMFPLISTRASSGAPYVLPLLGTLVMSLGVSTVLIFTYFLFPKLIIGILFGSKYYGVIPYLGLFSFFITIYSLNSILTYFLLSISYYKPIYPLFFVSLLQGLFIFLFHNSITEVIWVNIASSLFYLVIISFFVVKKEYNVMAKMFSKVSPRSIYGS